MKKPRKVTQYKWRECHCGNWCRKPYWKFGQCEACDPEFYYDKNVNKMTNISAALLLKSFGLSGLNRRVYEIDHIVPRWYARKYDIPDYEISSVANIQIMHYLDNSCMTEHGKGWLLPEQWINYLTSRKWHYEALEFRYPTMRDLCTHLKLSYILVASAFVKTGLTEVVVGGYTLKRVPA